VKVRDNNAKVEGRPRSPGNLRRLPQGQRPQGFALPGPEYNIRCIEAAVNEPFEQGLKTSASCLRGYDRPAERRTALTPSSPRPGQQDPDVPDDTAVIPVNKVGIIGAGTMGGGIAMNFMNAGIQVVMVEVKQGRPGARHQDRAEQLRTLPHRRAGGDRGADEPPHRLASTSTPSPTAIWFIEAVFERMDVKKEIFTKLDAICKPGAILATNTSGLNIDEIASVTKRPESVIGLHFFSPANVMKLLEMCARTTRPRGDQHLHEAGQEDRQRRRPGRVTRLRRQPHPRPAPARSQQADLRGRHALGRGPGALRLRLPHGPLRHERPGRPGHRLG